MDVLKIIRNWDKKPKELVLYLASKVKKDKSLLADVLKGLEQGSKVEKGVCVEVMEHVTKDKPEYGAAYILQVCSYLNFDAPRVRWEASRFVGNLAGKYPDKVEDCIDGLLENTKDKGTVVRWSTAFALGEIAKHNKSVQDRLVKKIKSILQKEDNNGVKNVYLKALKEIEKKEK
jgi:HEAT repeat protein